MIKENWPEWLKNAKISDDSIIVIENGYVIFKGGIWEGGTWEGGTWEDKKIDRLLFHAAFCGIIFIDDIATAYRSTNNNGSGRYMASFMQHEGEYYEQNYKPTGSGTCCKGIHITNASLAFTYFNVDFKSQLWEVKFKREDLLDCDGQKARIRGGYFKKIPCPFLISKNNS